MTFANNVKKQDLRDTTYRRAGGFAGRVNDLQSLVRNNAKPLMFAAAMAAAPLMGGCAGAYWSTGGGYSYNESYTVYRNGVTTTYSYRESGPYNVVHQEYEYVPVNSGPGFNVFFGVGRFLHRPFYGHPEFRGGRFDRDFHHPCFRGGHPEIHAFHGHPAHFRGRMDFDHGRR